MGFKKLIGMISGTHYKMERFCAVFLAFAVALGGLFGICMKIHQDNKKLTLGTQAKYTSQAQFSLSQDAVEVVNVYRDTGFTKTFVLLKLSSMQNLSIDAADYKMFMTSYEKNHPLTCNPTGAVYVFGNTGYIGLYLADDSGFEPALYDVVLRNTRMMVQGNKAAAAASFSDISYVNYNQMHLYANFAGSDAIIAKFLDKENPTVRDIYTELISQEAMDSVRTELTTTLLSMNAQMSLINEYAKRLNDYGLSVPELPAIIAGDYVTTDSSLTVDNPQEFRDSMLSRGSASDGTVYNVTVDAETEEEYATYVEGETLYLVTDYVCPGGIQYNFQEATMEDALLDTLKPESLTFEQWRSSKTSQKNQYASSTNTDKLFGNWTYKTGERFVTSQYDKLSQQIQPDINVYQNAVIQLINLKKEFQTSMLFRFLEEDASTRTIASMFSVRSDPETVTMY